MKRTFLVITLVTSKTNKISKDVIQLSYLEGNVLINTLIIINHCIYVHWSSSAFQNPPPSGPWKHSSPPVSL